MTKSLLPEGVPPDNKSLRAAAGNDRPVIDGANCTIDYRAPDMATPHFQRKTPLSQASLQPAIMPAQSDLREAAPDNADKRRNVGGWRALPANVRMMTHFAALGAGLALLVAIVLATKGGQLPLCSSQPDWNQHNCRAN